MNYGENYSPNDEAPPQSAWSPAVMASAEQALADPNLHWTVRQHIERSVEATKKLEGWT